jgi:hypothetical protein
MIAISNVPESCESGAWLARRTTQLPCFNDVHDEDSHQYIKAMDGVIKYV